MPQDRNNRRTRSVTWMYITAIVALSAFYYGQYITAGFSTADEGNYAQIAYELFLGRAPAELPITYGILWFKAGEFLFHAFGVQFAAVKLVFFTAITATNILIFVAITLATGSRPFALAATCVPLLVPAFPPTAFYGLCIALNAAAQMNMARQIGACTWRTAALAGAALAVSFQLRPDFGYIWSVPFVVLLALALRAATEESRRRILAGALGAFTAAHAPLLIMALAGGYIDVVARQYISYPATMISYAFSGLQVLLGIGQSAAETLGTTALQRPSPLSIWTGDEAEQVRAILIYAPVVMISAYGVIAARESLNAWRDHETTPLAVASVVLFAGAAAFPHYFFYRPDVSHIANFMPGFTVLAATLIWRLSHNTKTTLAWRTAARICATGLITAHLVFYAGYGLKSEATGSIAVAGERETPMTIEDRGTVFVSNTEHAQFSAIETLIRENSEPEDHIVCVPYCPGYAFMTGRRMLFDYFYVDDSIPLIDPAWLPQAITTTIAERPPVVIVMDWAINGTERSRFENWAETYMEALVPLARDIRTFPGLTVYLL